MTSKGRLQHVQQTLPALVAAGFDEIVVVDYDCPDKTSEWVHSCYPDVRIVKLEDEPIFNVSRARNLGAADSTSSWLIFVDADVEIAGTYLQWLRKHAAPGHFYRREKPATPEQADSFRGLYGTVACHRDAFDAIGGYDEAFSGWGMEDDDFCVRLLLSGCKNWPVPLKHFRRVIQHDDATRVAFYETKSKAVSYNIASLYCSFKISVMKNAGIQNLPLTLRKKLYNRICDAIGNSSSAGHGRTSFSIQIDEDLLRAIADLGTIKAADLTDTFVLKSYPHKSYVKQFDKQRFSTKLIKRAKRLATYFSSTA